MYKRRSCKDIERVKTAAVSVKDIFEMETSVKEIDKAYKALMDTTLLLRKFEAALSVKKIKNKVNEETGIDIDVLIDQVDKVADKMITYSIKLSAIKEKQG